jgi:hypothetical protein
MLDNVKQLDSQIQKLEEALKSPTVSPNIRAFAEQRINELRMLKDKVFYSKVNFRISTRNKDLKYYEFYKGGDKI